MTRTVSWLLLLALPAAGQLSFELPVTEVAGGGSVLYAIAGKGLFRSIDGGANWTAAYVAAPGRPQPIGNIVVSAPGRPGDAFVTGDASQGGVWKTSNAGETWERASEGLPGGAVQALFTVADQPLVLYALIGSQLYKTADGAATWRLQGALPGARSAFHINARTPSLMFYVSEARPTSDGGMAAVFRSNDEGATWQVVSHILMAPPGGDLANGCMGIASSPANPNLVFLTNRGAWQYYGQQDIAGTWRSSDGGWNFQNVRTGEPYTVLADLAGNWFFTEPETGNGEFTKSQGSDFRRIGIGPGEKGAPVLRLELGSPGAMLAGGNKGVYRSANAGETWRWIGGSVKGTLEAPGSPLAVRAAPGSGVEASIDLRVQFVEQPDWKANFDIGASGESWLALSANTGTTPATVTVRVNTADLAAGEHQATIRVSSPSALIPLEIPVKVTIGGAVSGPAYRIATIAGGARGYEGDGGPAEAARLNSPRGLAIAPGGEMYIADWANQRVRRILASGVIETVAGTGEFGYSGDGEAATSAKLWRPSAIAFDQAGGYYIADEFNNRLRRVDRNGIINTVASSLYGMDTVVADAAGNAYLPTSGTIRKYPAAGGPHTTYANGVASAGGLAFDSRGNLYIADTKNHRVWKVERANGIPAPVAGTGSPGYTGDGVPAESALLNAPEGVAVDAEDRLYIADTGNHRIRMVDRDGTIYTLAGSAKGSGGYGGLAQGALLNSPAGLVVDAQGNVYVSDTGNHSIRKLTPVRPEISAGGVRNAGNYTEEISPGGWFVIFGQNLATESAAAGEAPWPGTLGGAAVAINGRIAPLVFASAQQLVGQLPLETEPGTAQVTVAANGWTSPPASIQVVPASPGILASGENRCIALNQDGSPNSVENPAQAGDLILAFLVGIGPVDNPVATGAAAPATEPWSRATLPVRLTIGDREITPEFVGLTPGAVGLAQMNVKLPEDLSTGDYAIQVQIGDRPSNAPLIAVKSR